MGIRNKILIADRNPHIRDYLKRELSSCGYHVYPVENPKELLKLIYSRSAIDLLVLDPDFPGVDLIETARKIANRIPQLPVILYCIRGADDLSNFNTGNVFRVEKNGQSIDVLKAVIHNMLRHAAAHSTSSLKVRC